MERFGLFEILKNMLPFLDENTKTDGEQSLGDATQSTEKTERVAGDNPTNVNATNTAEKENSSLSRDAFLQFISSHETRVKRTKR